MPNFRNNLSNSCGKMLCKYFLPTSLKVATVSTISKIFLTDLLIKVAFSFQSIFAQPNLIEAAKKQTKHRGMKQKKSPLKYFHQKITQHVKCDHHFLHALFFFHFQPTMADKYSKYRSFFGISFNVLRMAVCFVWWHFHVSKH